VKAVGAELRGFVKDGKLVPGSGIELTPWALGLGSRVTYGEYHRNAASRVFTRSSFSVATAPTGDQAAVIGAAALRIRLWDNTDWRLNDEAIECARAVAQPPPAPDAPPEPGFIAAPPPSDDARKKTAKCLSENIRWNASQGAIGIGATTASAGGQPERTGLDTVATWAGIGVGLGDDFQLLISPRYTFRKSVPASTSATDPTPRRPKSHTAGISSRLTFRWDSGDVSLEGGLAFRRQSQTTDRITAVGLLLQRQLAPTAWVQLDFSAQLDTGQPGQLLGLSGIKWNYDLRPER
jgi:hypothetical protein